MQKHNHNTSRLAARRRLRIFLSYSHKDETLQSSVIEHLKILERTGAIDIWHDRKLLPGEKFDDSIRRNIRKCDLFVALISSAYLASDYCMDVELSAAVERFGEESEEIVPIILRPCAWKTFPPLAVRNALPKDGVPLSAFSDLDSGCQQIIESLNKLLSEYERFQLKYDDSRVLWLLRGTEDMNKIGLQAVIVNRLRILTKDFSLFPHRASIGTRLLIESTADALIQISLIETKLLSRLLNVEIVCLEGVDWNANSQLLKNNSDMGLSVEEDISKLLAGDSGEILLTATATEQEIASGGYTSHRLKSILINRNRTNRINVTYDCGNLRDDSIVAAREEMQDAYALLFEFLVFNEDKLRATIHWDPEREFMSKDFSASLAGTILFEYDYMLKRVVSDLLSPKHSIGKAFWSRAIKNAGIDQEDSDEPLFFAPVVEIFPKTAKVFINKLSEIKDTALFMDYMSDAQGNEEDQLIVLLDCEMGVRVAALTDPAKVANGDPEFAKNLELRKKKIDDFRKLGESGQVAFKEIILPIVEKELNGGWMLERNSAEYAAIVLASAAKSELKKWDDDSYGSGSLLRSVIDTDDIKCLDRISMEASADFKMGMQVASDARYKEETARSLFSTLGKWVQIDQRDLTKIPLEACYYVIGRTDFSKIRECSTN